MFTGIIEEVGEIVHIEKDRSNHVIRIKSSFTSELKVDQSVSHNGVCLTVTDIKQDEYSVVAIKETLDRSNLGDFKVGSLVNLERCLAFGGRLDGHFVQGHVDATAQCQEIRDEDGSWIFTFSYPEEYSHLMIDKGSVCLNGVSLTVIQPSRNSFSVAIIPYTFQHTNFRSLEVGDSVNIEFDVLGKYMARYVEMRNI